MASGDPIARGNIELGVDTTPMDAGLDKAKAKATQGAAEIQAAVAMKSEATAAAAAMKAEAPAATAAAKATSGFAASAKSVVAPISNAVGAVVTLIGRFNAVLAIGGLVTGTFLSIAAALNRKRDAARAAARELGELQIKIDALNNSPVSKAFDPDPEGTDLKAKYAERANQLYALYTEAAGKAAKAGKKTREAQLAAEFRDKENALLEEERLELESLRRREDLNRKMAANSAASDQYATMAKQIEDLKRQLDSASNTAFGRMEVSIEKLGKVVEAIRRNTGRGG